MLSRDHPEDQNKIQDNYKSEWFVIVAHHKDPDVYKIVYKQEGTKEKSQKVTAVQPEKISGESY